MEKSKQLSLVFILLLGFSFLYAESEKFCKMKDVNGFKTKFKTQTKLIKTIESNFTQEKHLEVISEVVKSKGIFYFKNPNKLRWQYDKPYKYIIVLNDETMMLQDNKKKKVLNVKSNFFFRKIIEIMSLSLQGKVLGNKDFKVSFFENKKMFMLKIKPQSKDILSMFNNINMYIDKNNYSVVKLEFSEKSGDYTKIVFNNSRINGEISDEKFIIK